MAMDSDEELLVQETEMEMVSVANPAKPTKRLGWFLPPTPVSGSPPFAPPRRHGAAAFLAAADDPKVSFKGWLGSPRQWEQWVAKLRPRCGDLWRKAGIFEAILASCCKVRKESCSLFGVASFWCEETNTFVFPWGEATVTLEDVAVLAGLPVAGEPVRAALPEEWKDAQAALNEVRLAFNRSACKKAHHSAWMKHFVDWNGSDELEHAAFLSLWLSRFVFPSHPEVTMRQVVFPLAVRLARGVRVALAPAVLASVYRDLREVRAYLGGKDGAALVVWAPLSMLQLWVWERFPALRPGAQNAIKDGEPRAARWHEVGRKVELSLVHLVLESPDEFEWQPYGTDSFKHACKNWNGWVRGGDISRNGELKSFAHCLRACELVGMDCIEQYLPHRVAMQFGFDQDVPGAVPRVNYNWEVAWAAYEIEGKNVAFFISQSEPEVTVRYVQWWKQHMLASGTEIVDTLKEVNSPPKNSKRKVKKTPAAAEAEAEKERKMKKARVVPSDKKRKLEDLYDAKLADWLVAKNGGSGSKKIQVKSEVPSSDDAEVSKNLALVAENDSNGGKKWHVKSEMPSSDDVEVSNSQTPLVMLKKKKQTPSVKPKLDNKMNLAKGPEGKARDNLGAGEKEKGGRQADGDCIVKRADQKIEETAVVEKEGSAVTEDAKGAHTKELVSTEPVMKDPPEIMEDTMKMVGVKSSGLLDMPEEVLLKQEKKEEIKGDVNNGSKEEVVTDKALVVQETSPSGEKMEILEECKEDNTTAGEVGRISEGELSCAEATTGNKKEDEEVVNNGREEVAVAEEVLAVEQVNPEGESVEVLEEDKEKTIAGDDKGIHDEDLPCGEAVTKEPEEVLQVEQTEGDAKELTEKDTEEKDMVEAVKNSVSEELPCTSASEQSKEGEKKEVVNKDMEEKACIKDVELANEKELPSDATVMEADETKATEGTNYQESLEQEEVCELMKSSSDITLVEADNALSQKQAMEEGQDQRITDEKQERRISEDVAARNDGESQYDSTLKVADENLPTTEAGNSLEEKKVADKSNEESVVLEANKGVTDEGSSDSQAAIKEFEETPLPKLADLIEENTQNVDNKLQEVASGQDGREVNGASAQDLTSANVTEVTPSNMDNRREENKVSMEDLTSDGKSADDQLHACCQLNKEVKPSVEEVRRINNGRSLYHMKHVKEPEGTLPPEPSNRTRGNNGGNIAHQLEELVTFCKEDKTSIRNVTRAFERDSAQELLLTDGPEECSRRRREAYTLQMLEDAQAARLAEKTRMEMEIRMLKAQIATMQAQVMNLDYMAEVISRSKKQ